MRESFNRWSLRGFIAARGPRQPAGRRSSIHQELCAGREREKTPVRGQPEGNERAASRRYPTPPLSLSVRITRRAFARANGLFIAFEKAFSFLFRSYREREREREYSSFVRFHRSLEKRKEMHNSFLEKEKKEKISHEIITPGEGKCKG